MIKVSKFDYSSLAYVITFNNLDECYDITKELSLASDEDVRDGYKPEKGPSFATVIDRALKSARLYVEVEKAWRDAGGRDEDRPALGFTGCWRPTPVGSPSKSWSW